MKTNQYQTPNIKVIQMSVSDDILVVASPAELEDYRNTDWDWNA